MGFKVLYINFFKLCKTAFEGAVNDDVKQMMQLYTSESGCCFHYNIFRNNP